MTPTRRCRGTCEHRDRAEHEAHQPDQPDQCVLDCLVGSGHQQPVGLPADDEGQHLLRQPGKQAQAERHPDIEIPAALPPAMA